LKSEFRQLRTPIFLFQEQIYNENTAIFFLTARFFFFKLNACSFCLKGYKKSFFKAKIKCAGEQI